MPPCFLCCYVSIQERKQVKGRTDESGGYTTLSEQTQEQFNILSIGCVSEGLEVHFRLRGRRGHGRGRGLWGWRGLGLCGSFARVISHERQLLLREINSTNRHRSTRWLRLPEGCECEERRCAWKPTLSVPDCLGNNLFTLRKIRASGADVQEDTEIKQFTLQIICEHSYPSCRPSRLPTNRKGPPKSAQRRRRP